MAGYMLYIPGCQGANNGHLARVGLESLGIDRWPEWADALQGPDRGRGMFCEWRCGTGDINWESAKCDWRPAKADKKRDLAAKRFWIGIPRGATVTPEQVKRKVSQPGYWVTLRDGQQWHIPAAAQLPHGYTLGEDGELSREVLAEFADYWRQSEQYALSFFKAIDQLEFLKAQKPHIDPETTVEFTLADTWAFCCKALSINYRVTPEIVDFLGLLADDPMRDICKAAIELPVLLEQNREKKKADVVGVPVGLST